MDYNKADLDSYLMGSLAQDHEWSDAANAAFLTVAHLKKAKVDLMWISGDEKEKNSDGVSIRWVRLKGLMEYICKPMADYNPGMLGAMHKRLLGERRDIDSANMDFESIDDPIDTFSWLLDQYADVIVSALKRQMDEYERSLFDLNS